MPGSRLIRIAIFLLLIPAWLAATDAAGADQPIELLQADGGSLQLEAPASRLVTLSPHLAELVFAAGAGQMLVATVAYSNFPPEVTSLPLVGDAFRVDVERIHQLKPDLILAWQSGNPPSALSQLEQLGFSVWTLEILSPGGIADAVEAIGRASGTQAQAGEAARDLRNKISILQQGHAEREAVSYFYQVAPQPLYTVNGQHLISRGLALCAGRNVFSDLPGLAPQIGLEAVLLADPMALFAPEISDQPDPLAQWTAWPRLQAVQQGNLLLLPADAISRATPRFFDALELACSMLDDLRQPRGSQTQ